MELEWDEAKAVSNKRKHGVSFPEAQTVFEDPLAVIFDDDDPHSIGEQREIIIGHSGENRLLLVCFTQKDYEENILLGGGHPSG
jgi:uncharacterized DUF497 family protein